MLENPNTIKLDGVESAATKNNTATKGLLAIAVHHPMGILLGQSVLHIFEASDRRRECGTQPGTTMAVISEDRM